MNAIKQALERLNAALNVLEFNVDVSLANKPGHQGDMFDGGASAQPAASNQNNALIAERLDNAIETVEKLLKGA